MVFNGKPTREWLSREDASSPTASLEAIFLTATIDANEESERNYDHGYSERVYPDGTPTTRKGR